MENTAERIFREIGMDHGYLNVTVDTTELKEMKVVWERTADVIRFFVCDYLADSPPEVLESIADTIFRRIGGDDTATYSDAVVEYLSSEEFAKKNQRKYVKRIPGMRGCGDVDRKDLRASLRRLQDSGLVKGQDDLYLGWMRMSGSHHIGHASVTMRVAALNSKLDSETITDEMLDYALYSQIAFLELGFSRNGAYRGKEYDAALDLYPGRREMEKELRKIGLEV